MKKLVEKVREGELIMFKIKNPQKERIKILVT